MGYIQSQSWKRSGHGNYSNIEGTNRDPVVN